jgi:hypothetical protein
MWFTKSRRAQNDDDYETWIEGGVSPTLNIFDNGTDTRATVLIIPVLMRQREGKPGGGKGPLMSENLSLTIATANDQILFQPIGFSHTQGLDPQASNERFPTLITEGGGHAVAYGVGGEVSHALTAEGHDASEDGTGRGTPVIAYSIREDAQANNFSATEIETSRALQAQQPSVQSHHAQTFIAQQTVVRRLTPTECERLQGFPDGWTAQRYDFKKSEIVDQADSSRYKQMGNAVAVPCVQWLLQRVVLALSDA